MTLIRWEPFQEVDTLQREINRLFESIIDNKGQEKDKFSLIPPAEMEETDNAIDLRLELPGMDPKDLDIQVTTDSVSISGERKSEAKTEEKGVIRSEFRYGQFRRVIPLPTPIDNKNVKAEYKDGVIHLNLPKVEAEKQKVVKVNLGE
jgi:HSP20 family protein